MAASDGMGGSAFGGMGLSEKVSELLLITQYFDTLVHVSQGNATTIFLPHEVGGAASAAGQMRNGIMQGMSMSRK